MIRAKERACRETSKFKVLAFPDQISNRYETNIEVVFRKFQQKLSCFFPFFWCRWLFFSISRKKTCQRTFGPTMVSYGFDRARKTAQDALKSKCEKFAHSTLIWFRRWKEKHFYIGFFYFFETCQINENKIEVFLTWKLDDIEHLKSNFYASLTVDWTRSCI